MVETEKHEGGEIEQTLGLEPPKGGRRLMIWAAAGIAAVAVILAIAYLVSKNNGNRIRYSSQEVTRGDLTVTVTATGTLEPINKVDVGVEVSGTIEKILVDFNDLVKAGQVLAELDTSKLRAQVLQAKAAVDSARAKVLRAQADIRLAGSKLAQLKKARELTGGRLPSQQDIDGGEAALDVARADEASAKAEVQRAEADLAFNETNLSKAIIRSPIKGIVLSRHVEPGQTVAASLQTPVMFTIAEDLTRMELHVDVDEADFGKIKTGQVATFTVDAYPVRTFRAKVTEVRFSPKTVEGVVTYETLLSVDNPDLTLIPGMTATAEVVVKEVKGALLIPNAALRFTPPPRRDGEQKKNTGLLGALLPRRPRRKPSRTGNEELWKSNQRVVWTLTDKQPVSIPVTIGDTDGMVTEVLAGEIEAGLPLITEMVIQKK